MKLLIDMNLSPRWAEFFSSVGIEAVHWSVIGAAHAADSEIMAYAETNGFTVFTHDLDFGTILAFTHSGKPSVVQIRIGDVEPKGVAVPVVSALQQFAADIEKGALVTIDPLKIRLRLLPLI